MPDLSLGRTAEDLGISEALRLADAEVDITLREQKLRETVASEIFAIFKRANTVTFVLVAVLCIVDVVFLSIPVAAYQRLITSEVIITLIGATVVQAGAAAFAIAVSLFPKARDQ
jgi:hypothetical protein